MESKTISLGIPGLDLVLGGGIRVQQRTTKGKGSTMILVRGGAGAGKTILGAHIAAALVSGFEGREPSDIAYACIEILPTELQAQLAGFQATKDLPFSFAGNKRSRGGFHVIRAALLELANGRDSLGEGLVALLDDCEREGFFPKVLVVDSLSDGYGFGKSVAREIADGVCKIAVERGLCLVLLEETKDARPSPWSFAVDVVLELTREADEFALQDRHVSVSKSRFSATDLGPHALVFEDQRVFVMPRPRAYLWASGNMLFPHLFTARQDIRRNWNVPELNKGNPPFSPSITAIIGTDSQRVRQASLTLGRAEDKTARAIHVNLQRISAAEGYREKVNEDEPCFEISAGHPLLSPERLIHLVLEAIRTADQSSLPISLVRIGDLQALRSTRNEHGIREAISVLSVFLVKSKIPVILSETADHGELDFTGHLANFGILKHLPLIVDYADLLITLPVNLGSFGPVKAPARATNFRFRKNIEVESLLRLLPLRGWGPWSTTWA